MEDVLVQKPVLQGYLTSNQPLLFDNISHPCDMNNTDITSTDRTGFDHPPDFCSKSESTLISRSVSRRGMIVGIAGCTNAGKTTIAQALLNKLTEEKRSAAIVCQDDFFYTKEHQKTIRNKEDPSVIFYDYDRPESIDEHKFMESVQNTATTNDVVVVEGNMLTELSSVYNLMDKVVFLKLDREICWERREKRDDYDPPDEPGYFEQIVWPAYEQHLKNALTMAQHSERLQVYDASNGDVQDKLVNDLCVDLLRIQQEPIRTDDAVDYVTAPNTGASSVFVGTTRNTFHGKEVVHLEYEAYEEMAYKEMRKICTEIRGKFKDVHRIAIIHRVGTVAVREASVVIAVSSPHRWDAMRATEMAIEELKRRVPIWKKEVYSDGTCSWKSNKDCGGCAHLKGPIEDHHHGHKETTSKSS